MIIDFSKCAVLECYGQKPYWSNEKPETPEWYFSRFQFLFPYKGDWLVINARVDQINWDNPIFNADDIDYFLDHEHDLIKFLPADLAKEMINIWIRNAQKDGQTWYMQSSFQKAKRIAKQLEEEDALGMF